MPQQPMPMTTHSPSPQPHPDPLHRLQQASARPPHQNNNEPDTHNISTTTDSPKPILLTALTLPPPPMTQQPTPTQPSPPILLPLPLPDTSVPSTPATPTPQIHLSLMERLILTNTPANAAIWTPDAPNRHHPRHHATATHWLTGHHPTPVIDPLLSKPTTPQHRMINLPNNQQGIDQSSVTLLLTPVPHKPSKQPHHALHQTTLKPASTVPSPWLVTHQRSHQYPFHP